jgi:hypothetical protein
VTPQQQDHLWRLLGQTYGHKFADQYGPSPNEAWAAAMASMTADQAKFAFRKLVDGGSPFPPTLPEFVALAKGAPRSEVRYDANGVAYIHGDRPAILTHEQPAMTPEQVEFRRQQMRDLLKGIR